MRHAVRLNRLALIHVRVQPHQLHPHVLPDAKSQWRLHGRPPRRSLRRHAMQQRASLHACTPGEMP
eukprot:7185313-Lingulodinium_polyedra.AAC.1